MKRLVWAMGVLAASALLWSEREPVQRAVKKECVRLLHRLGFA